MANPGAQLDDTPLEVDIDADTCFAISCVAFERANLLTDEKRFDTAIIFMEKSLARTPLNSLNRPQRLYFLGLMKLQRNIGEDFNQAIAAIQQAISATPDSNPDRQTYLNRLGSELLAKFYETERFDYLQELIDSTPQDDPDRTAWLINLSVVLGQQYQENGRWCQLDASIRIAQYAADTRSNNSDQIAALNTLSMYLNKRYQITSNHDDLREAIQHVRKAVTLAIEPGDNRAASLSNLAIYLRLEYSCTRDIQVLHDAVDAAKQSVKAAIGASSSVHCLTALSSALEKRYDELGDVSDLTEALQTSRLASQEVSNSVGEYQSVFNNLGGLLEVMYLRTGNVDYLDESIQVTQQAVKSVPEKHVDRALMLDNLATRLGQQYQRTGQSELLEESISLATLAVEATQPKSIYLAERLNNLGTRLLLRHIRSPNISDLEKAIEVTNHALLLVSKVHSSYFLLRNNLATLLQYKSRFLRAQEYLDQGISILAEIVKEMEELPTKHSGLTSTRHNLAVKLSERFDLQRQDKDIEKAVEILELTVESLSEEDRYLSFCLKSLGNAYRKQSSTAQNRSHLIDKALKSFIRSSALPQAVPLVRIKAMRQAMSILHQKEDWQQADQLAAKALALLPLVCGRYLRREDQVHVMSQVSGLAADACSIALKLGEVDRALEYLELGRGVIARYVLDSKSELDDLRKDYPDLARSYEEESFKVNATVDSRASATASLSPREEHVAVQRLEVIVKKIQGISKYEGFLKGPSIDELKSHATSSPVAVVNVTDIGSDAIIFTKTYSKVVSLPKLHYKTAPISFQQQFSQYTSSRASDEGRKMPSEDDADDEKDDLPERLSWLWSNCVEPILEEVYSVGVSPPSTEPPRIWWLGSGVAASFPFHAARDRSCDPERDALHRVVSSYCSTIRTLQHSQASASSRAVVEGGIVPLLVVTMPTTPGQKSLRGAEKEKSAIEEICKSLYSVEGLESPTADRVLGAIPTAEILHFACHGTSDPANPLNSHLLLQKRVDNRTIVDRLSVSKISRVVAAGKARMAYLSACSTAETKDKRLRDEGLHITSAFQMAGLAHVIGSLWTADDEVCVKVARAFYNSLTRGGTMGNFSDDQVPRALRDAVLSIQSQQPESPALWAQFVHFGA